MKINFCCSTMERAFQRGTDSECYGAVAYFGVDGVVCIGSMSEPLFLCPWCGCNTSKIKKIDR